jgi:hypothetical protein
MMGLEIDESVGILLTLGRKSEKGCMVAELVEFTA